MIDSSFKPRNPEQILHVAIEKCREMLHVNVKALVVQKVFDVSTSINDFDQIILKEIMGRRRIEPQFWSIRLILIKK